MTSIITDVVITESYPYYRHYHYYDLNPHVYKTLTDALTAGMKNGTIVDYMIFNREVLNNDEKRH